MTPGNSNGDEASCVACGAFSRPGRELFLVCADYGYGAFLDVLCRQCDHRRWYRAELERRRRARRAGHDEAPNQGLVRERSEDLGV